MLENQDYRLALAYGNGVLRPAFATLLRLDANCGAMVAAVREPHLGSIRLAWWSDQLASLDVECYRADPLLIECAALVRRYDVIPADLAHIVDGWDKLLMQAPLTAESLAAFGRMRGHLFALAARIAGCDVCQDFAHVGAGWALTDFAFGCSHRETAITAAELANHQFACAGKPRWPSALRPFAILAQFARDDLRRGIDRGRATGSPVRIVSAVRTIIAN